VLRRRRYLEARVAWGRVVSHCRNVLRQSSLWLNDIDAGERWDILHQLRGRVWAFPRCLASHLSGPEAGRQHGALLHCAILPGSPPRL